MGHSLPNKWRIVVDNNGDYIVGCVYSEDSNQLNYFMKMRKNFFFQPNSWFKWFPITWNASCHGSMKTEKPIQLVNSRLSKFKLDLGNDIVETITDGAIVMVKFGKETSPIHITCLAHAIYCVYNILSKPHKMNDDVFDDVTEEEDDYDET